MATIFGASSPGTQGVFDDGQPITVGNTFYTDAASANSYETTGARLYVDPANVASLPSTATVNLLANVSDLGTTPVRTETATIGAGGWIEVTWDTPYALTNGTPVMVSYQFDTDNEKYLSTASPGAGAIASGEDADFFMSADSEAGGWRRSNYRYGTGATNAVAGNLWGVDLIVTSSGGGSSDALVTATVATATAEARTIWGPSDLGISVMGSSPLPGNQSINDDAQPIIVGNTFYIDVAETLLFACSGARIYFEPDNVASLPAQVTLMLFTDSSDLSVAPARSETVNVAAGWVEVLWSESYELSSSFGFAIAYQFVTDTSVYLSSPSPTPDAIQSPEGRQSLYMAAAVDSNFPRSVYMYEGGSTNNGSGLLWGVDALVEGLPTSQTRAAPLLSTLAATAVRPVRVESTTTLSGGDPAQAQTRARAPQVGVSVPATYFTPPTYEEPIRTTERPLAYYRLTQASSVVRINGSLQTVRTPYVDQLVGEAGVDYFIGGHIYEVSAETAAELAAAGYELQEEPE